MNKIIISLPTTAKVAPNRALAIYWVFWIEFSLTPEGLHPTAYERLLEALISDNKNPMEWTDKECDEFLLSFIDSIQHPRTKTGLAKLVDDYAPNMPIHFLSPFKYFPNE